MAIRIRFGRSPANGGTGRSPLLPLGLFVTAWGLLLAWIGHEKGDTALIGPGLVVAASGAWIAGLHRLVRNRAKGLAVAGGLLTGWGLAGGIAAARYRSWFGAVVCAFPVYAGLLLLGVLPSPDWVQKVAAAARRYGIGLVFMGAGLFFVAVALAGGASKGVPAFVLVAAGLTFFLGGVLAASHRPGSPETVLTRVLVALLVTALGTTGVVFPPSLLFTAPMAVLSWIAVVRLVVEKRTGRDPFAGWSDERQLGLGCGVTVIIALLIVGLLQLRSCARQPEARPPAEAVGLGS